MRPSGGRTRRSSAAGPGDPVVRQREWRRPRPRGHGDQAERRAVRRAAARAHGRRRTRRWSPRRGRPATVVGHADPPRAIPALAGRRRHRPHPLDGGHRLGPGPSIDPAVRDDPRRSFPRRRPGHADAHRGRGRGRLRGRHRVGHRRGSRDGRVRPAGDAGGPGGVAWAVRLGSGSCVRGRQRHRPRGCRGHGQPDPRDRPRRPTDGGLPRWSGTTGASTAPAPTTGRAGERRRERGRSAVRSGRRPGRARGSRGTRAGRGGGPGPGRRAVRLGPPLVSRGQHR